MKRVKIMLSAITVLAVVGGALAFKAQDFTTRRFYHNNGEQQPKCNIAVDLASKVDNIAGVLSATYSTTSSNSVACIGVKLIADN